MPTSVARVVGLVGIAALAGGAWLSWIHDVAANHIPAMRLFGSHMKVETDTFVQSIAMILVVCAVLGLFGVLLPSGAAAFIPALVAIATVTLLLVQEWRVLPGRFGGDVVGGGVWCSGAGAIVLLLATTGLYVDVQRGVVHS